MMFKFVCKVCGKHVEEESLIKHVKTHKSTDYFDVVPEVGWK